MAERPLNAPRGGYDHPWFGFRRLPVAAGALWPDRARVAISVVIELSAVEWERPGQEPVVAPIGGRGVAPYPDFPRMSHREYGHRVGIFRLLQLLDAFDVVPALSLDVLTCEHYPDLLARLLPHQGELLAGGLSGSRPITSLMEDREEADYIGSCLERFENALGMRPRGWLSPGRSESSRTPRLLAEAGIEYVLDWANDELPYAMDGAGHLWSYPLSWELSDVAAGHLRGVPPRDYGRSLVEAFDMLHQEGGRGPRLLSLHLQPWESGQPFRAAALEETLKELHGREGVWWSTPGEILDWWRGSGEASRYDDGKWQP